MSITVFGMNHQTAPVAVREQVAFAAEQLPAALRAVLAQPGIAEAVILSTCNRTELYAVGDTYSKRQLAECLVQGRTLGGSLERHFYTHTDEAAVRHTLRVACGLDSMVVGEPQILGQVKDAYQAALTQGTTGKQLNKLMQYAFAIAKKVRTETAIGATPVSVAYAAVRLAQQVHGDLAQRRALLIGAGDTIQLAAQHLKRYNIAELVIANRTVARAAALATVVGGRAIGLGDIPAELPAADIILASATTRLPLLTRAMLEAALKVRREQPIFIVDLAVPRNVDPAAEGLDDVYLYTVDDLNRVITDNLEIRHAAAREAEEMITTHAQGFMDWLQSLDANQVVVAYRQQVDALTAATLGKAQRQLRNGEDASRVLTQLARTLANKMAHQPLARLREAATEGRADILETARELLLTDLDRRSP